MPRNRGCGNHTVFRKVITIAFRELNSGCRAYLSVGGGWEVPEIMGSKSTNLSSGFGGLDGRPFQKGDVLWSASPQLHMGAGGRQFDLNAVPAYRGYWELRVVLGPQDDHFGAAVQDLFLNADYRVSAYADRTGIRLLGAQIWPKRGGPNRFCPKGWWRGPFRSPATDSRSFFWEKR